MSGSSVDTQFDAIVVGSGAGGLTAALRLAQSGLKTALLEKNAWLGGYSRGFGKDGFYWDHGGHIFLAYRLGAQAREVFQRLQIDQHVEMVPDKHDYRCVFPDESLAIPADITEAADIFAQRFPEERAGIERVLLIMERMIDEVDLFVPSFNVPAKPGKRGVLDPIKEQFQRPRLGGAVAPLLGATHAPGATLTKYQNRTLTQLLDEHLVSPRLKAYFSQLSAGIGAAPGELSAVIAGVFFIHALRTMWMPHGGFSKLADGLAEMFQEAGGQIFTDSEVGRVVVEDGHVVGVETVDGRRFNATSVVSNADGRRTLLDMVEPQHLPAELRERVARMALTPSIFQVHLGIDMDLEPYRANIQRLNFIYPHDNIDVAMSNFANGNVEEAAFFLYVATFHQPEMAPPGMHSLKLEAYTRMHAKGIDWERDKEDLAKVFIRRAEALIPGLSQHIVTQALRTPLDLHRDTGNSDGAFAGWAFTPELLSRARPTQRTPLPGLYMAGHWTTPTAGVPWVMVSGYNTAGMVLADRANAGRSGIGGTLARMRPGARAAANGTGRGA